MPDVTTHGYPYLEVGDAVYATAEMSQDLAEAIEAKVKTIQSGSDTAAVGSGSQTKAVVFPFEFASTPQVVANLDGSIAEVGGVIVGVANITTTGCDVRLNRISGSATSVTFRWIAHG